MPTTPTIDLVSLIEQHAPVRLTKVATSHGGEWAGNCMFCGGVDRLRVWPYGERSHYWCRVCEQSGDAIQFLKDYCHLSYVEACETLGLKPDETIKHAAPMIFDDDPPCKEWQAMARLLIEKAETYLWEHAHHALEYLLKRGLTEQTIKAAHLGYVPIAKDGKWYTRSFADWGLSDAMLSDKQKEKGNVKVPPGILIPWEADGQCWKLAIKRFEATKDGEMRYGQVVGSRDCIYNSDSLARGKPVLLCEGEIDVLSAQQEAGDLIAPLGTGSASKGQLPLWIARIYSAASPILVGFDNDGNQAGDTGADYWLATFPSAMRLKPLAHDINDMLCEQKNIKAWIATGLVLATQPPPTPTQPQPETPLAQETPIVVEDDEQPIEWYICATCEQMTMHVNADGLCSWCWFASLAPAPAEPQPTATPLRTAWQ